MTNSDFFDSRDKRFLIDGAVGDIEVLTRAAKPVEKNIKLSDWLVILCHPHPLFGGSMDNKVVTTMARAARECGLDSLRFNFRGIGQSEGEHGDFVGELDDFSAVNAWIKKHLPHTKFIYAGFSFGSAVVANQINQMPTGEHIVLIGPAVEKYQYPKEFRLPLSVIQGAADEVVSATAVTDWVSSISSGYDYYVMGHTGHFFHGKLSELRHKLMCVFDEAIK